MHPYRSVLFMPGHKEKLLKKGQNLPCDAIIMDWEDAVAPDAKAEARSVTLHAIQNGGYGMRKVIVRINALSSPYWQDDVKALASVGHTDIAVAKVESQMDLAAFMTAYMEHMPPNQQIMPNIWAMIESPRAIMALEDIVSGPVALHGLIAGTNDLLKDMQATAVEGRANLSYALSKMIIAARSMGLMILDGVYNDFSDEAGLIKDCQQGRHWGFDGKTLIHPSQINGANQAFSIAESDYIEAKAMIDAYKQSMGGAVRYKGRMIEALHIEIAMRDCALYEAAEKMAEEHEKRK